MTTFLIVYIISAILLIFATVKYLNLYGSETIQIKGIIFTVVLIFLPIVNSFCLIILGIAFIDDYDKELKNPFYKEKDRD